MKRNLIIPGAVLVVLLACGGCGGQGQGTAFEGTDVTQQLTDLLDRTTGALNGVSDSATAHSSLETLRSVDAYLDDLVLRAAPAAVSTQEVFRCVLRKRKVAGSGAWRLGGLGCHHA